MIRIAVCDDDMIFASSLESKIIELAKKRYIEIDTEVFVDGAEFLAHERQSGQFDILFLDIEMTKINGIELAKQLRESSVRTLIIYVSSYDTYMMELFEVEPFRFLKKPVSEEKLEDYLIKAAKRVQDKRCYFEYRFNKASYKVPLDEILYFSSSRREITITHVNGSGTFYGKLSQIENDLKEANVPFLRIHQSHLVNYNYIRKMGFSSLTMDDGKVLRVSEERQRIIRNRYNELLREEFLDG